MGEQVEVLAIGTKTDIGIGRDRWIYFPQHSEVLRHSRRNPVVHQKPAHRQVSGSVDLHGMRVGS